MAMSVGCSSRGVQTLRDFVTFPDIKQFGFDFLDSLFPAEGALRHEEPLGVRLQQQAAAAEW